MPLLNLPMEIFEEVIAALANKVDRRNVVRYRLVCKTFANIIKDHIVTVAAARNLAKFLENPFSARLFDTYRVEILYKATMRRQTAPNQVIHFIRAMVKASKPDPRLHSARIMLVCTSMMALESKALHGYIKGTVNANKGGRPDNLADMRPFIAAATGNMKLFELPTLTPALLLEQRHNLLPSALKAAIVADQDAMLRKILKYVVDNVKGKPDAKTWKDMRSAARQIGEALCMAVRLHKNVAANTLFDFRDANEPFARSMSWFFGDRLLHCAIDSTNTAVLYRVLGVDNPGVVAHVKEGSKTHYRIDSISMEILYKRGGIVFWRMLLKDGVVGPNELCSDKTPLQHALKKRRYDIARILIKSGAVVDTITPDGSNVLWQAAKDGFAKDVEFLLDHGADPNSVGKDGKSALAAAESGQYGKCRFSLRQAIDQRKEESERRELDRLAVLVSLL
ncbi:hypothetical protein J4E93_000543 [Alternaria ventricosa]|uniref:uncharacterized protein n=1 Tax=Alternaria ventricosa TaxID=1187951 RepID=UPI0020C54EE8|nr:uncharacterized protein J4E93_000543 [Alternaria ventricosa]KAI4655828.1 hypothetical protein J4E93_000543 [Alternaria ventricosa]